MASLSPAVLRCCQAQLRGDLFAQADGAVVSAGAERKKERPIRSTRRVREVASSPTSSPPPRPLCLGVDATRINAADLFIAGDQEYLLVTPETAAGVYRGCFVFAIDDPAIGALRRDGAGRPLVMRRLDVGDGQFNCACTYAEGAPGYLVPALSLAAPPVFRIIPTQVTAP